MNNNANKILKILAIVLVVVIITVSSFYFAKIKADNDLGANSMIDNSQIIETQNYTVDYNDFVGTDGVRDGSQLVFVSPENTRINIKDDVAVKISSVVRTRVFEAIGGEDINRVIKNPVNSNLLLIATDDVSCGQSSEKNNPCSSVNRFYNYNLVDGSLSLFYTDDARASVNQGVSLDPFATKSSQIIFIEHNIGTGGICGGVWTLKDKYYYLDVNNISEGLKPFKAPEELIKRDKDEEEKCYERLNNEQDSK